MLKKQFVRFINYLKNDQIEIRNRMMLFMEMAVVAACVIATIGMLILQQPWTSIAPNFVVLLFGILGLVFSAQEKYDLASFLLITGGAYIALPYMFFSAGGNYSGMPIWFVFGVIFTCMMSKGIARLIMVLISLGVDIACIVIAQYKPEYVNQLDGTNAGFYDMLQSFITVSLIVGLVVHVYLETYNRQRKMLEVQSLELSRIIYEDALTGLKNRRAYYDRINEFKTEEDYRHSVVIAMDVNGLKKVNDTLGHSEGDEFLQTAAGIIKNAYAKYGDIFRTGGDEFMAVLNCSDNEVDNLKDILKQSIKEGIKGLDKPWAVDFTIAIGIVKCSDFVNEDFQLIEKQADERMYKDKSDYYRSSGRDRRR